MINFNTYTKTTHPGSRKVAGCRLVGTTGRADGRAEGRAADADGDGGGRKRKRKLTEFELLLLSFSGENLKKFLGRHSEPAFQSASHLRAGPEPQANFGHITLDLTQN